MKHFLLSLLLGSLTFGLLAQTPSPQLFRQQAKAEFGVQEGMQMLKLDDPICNYLAEDEAKGTHIGPPAEALEEIQFRNEGSDCGTIEVTYVGFEGYPDALNAFQYAVDIWESQITSAVPIKVTANFTPLPPGVLGSAGPTFVIRDFGAGLPGTWYGSALADAIAGVDLIPGAADINANFSSSFGWYFGRDGNPPPGTYDFVTVVLHELGHGLGFFGSGNAIPNPVLGVYGFGSPPFATVYDNYVQNSAGTTLADLAPPGVVSPALGAYLQSNDLFVNAPSAVAANGGLPAIYAPTTFRRGSSFSHWDEATFPAGTPQSLMTPFLGFQEAIHDPGTATLGMFADHGWAQTADCTPPEPIDDTEPCRIYEVSLDPVLPFPICDDNGFFGPAGSHFVYVRVEGIDPLNQPLDPSAYAAKVKGKDYPIFDLGYDYFEGELYFYMGIAGIPSDGKKNQQVKITLENGCVAVGERLYTAPTCEAEAAALAQPQTATIGGANLGAPVSLEVYPNPTSGRFTLRTGQEGSGIVQLFNAMGQKVYQTMVQAYDSRDIDLSHLGSGVYILRLQGDKETHTRQVIVNR